MPTGAPEKPNGVTAFALRWCVRRSGRFEAVFAVAAIVIATGLRFALDGWLPAGFPFLTFFPAIILTAFFAGPRAGAVVALVTGLVAWGFFLAPGAPFSRAPTVLLAMLFFAFIAVTDVLLVHVMTTALRRMAQAEARSSSLALSRALMFNELQHRVSNNIATIGALLHLQERRVTDPQARAALADARTRLDVVARLQRRLHDPDRQSVEMAEFIEGLAQDTLKAMDAADRLTCICDLQPFRADPEQAMPLGLVAAELLMNACEHAFPGGEEGLIVIRFARNGASARLTIEDDGRGLPEGFAADRSQSLGLSIARQFAGQLGGELAVRPRAEGGTRAELAFPVPAA